MIRNNINYLKTSSEFDSNKFAIRPFIRMKSLYRVAPKHRLSVCLVEKNMCTLMQAIVCYLYDSEGFVRGNRTLAKESWSPSRFCNHRNEVDNTLLFKATQSFTQQTVFIARDPVSRFLSAFLHICVKEKFSCYGCKTDILCVVQNVYIELKLFSMKHWNVRQILGDQLHISVENKHFAPQTWQCDLLDEAKNFIFLKYGENATSSAEMKRELLELLNQHNISHEKLRYIEKNFSYSQRSTHSTRFSESREEFERILRGSEMHLKILTKIYYYDYVIFGFSPPVSLNELN